MKTWFTITNEAKAAAAEIDIFDEIGLWGVAPKDFAQALAAVPMDRDITLRINSPGGSIFDGFAIFNMIAARKERVTAHIIGLAASMATIVMLAAKKVTAASNSTLMIHKPAGGAWGESGDMREMADLLDKLEGQLVNTYAAKTGKKETEIRDAMAETTWFTAEEAKAWGLVDEVTDAVKVAASFDLTRFGVLPKNISGSREASTNQPTKPVMKNLIKSLVDAKLIASTDVSEDTAVAQFAAAFAELTNKIAEQAAQITDLNGKLTTASATIADHAKTTAETVVDSAVKAGRIADNKDLRATWVAAFLRDASGTKAMIEALPATNRGVAPINTNNSQKPERPSTHSVWAKQFNK